MPTYEYRCPKGHEFEKFQRMSEPPVAQCPACGQEATRLLSGGAGLLFKGEGFYITDYRSDSYKKEAEREKPTDAKAGTKSDAKSDSKGDSGSAGSKPAADRGAADKPASGGGGKAQGESGSSSSQESG